MKHIALLVTIAALIASGCAGIRPFVGSQQKIPVLTATPLPADTSAAAASGDTLAQAGATTETAVSQTPARPDGMTVIEPTPTDELSLPEEAYPLPPDSLNKEGFIPNGGPQAPGEEPPELGKGWKVQVGSYTDKQVVNAADAELKMRLPGLPVHLRYLEDHYILLVGNYIQRESADSLRDVLRDKGYSDAFVVQAPVVVGPGGEKSDTSAVSSEQLKADTSSAAPAPVTAPGFRIQVMSVSTQAAAEQEAKQAEARTGLRAYIVEVDGVYKVRLGDFTAKMDANSRLDRLATLGYPGAFIVEETVNVGQSK